MLIGRIIGDVVATQKSPSHEGRKILVVQPLNLDGTDRGDPVLALDAVDAGIGERVLLTTEGFSAMTAVGRPSTTRISRSSDSDRGGFGLPEPHSPAWATRPSESRASRRRERP